MASYSMLSPGDKIIGDIVPHYSETLDIVVHVLAHDPPESVLDLGAGPGRISEVLHHSFPKARLTLLDQYEEVLETARERLAGVESSFVTGDYTTCNLGSGYGAIVAGLTLHHLDDESKQRMLPRLRDALADGGVLVISDIVRGSTPAWHERYENLWFERLKQLPPEDGDDIKQHYLDEDHPATIEAQLGWLREAGFEEIGCHWQHLNFAVWSGRKPAVG